MVVKRISMLIISLMMLLSMLVVKGEDKSEINVLFIGNSLTFTHDMPLDFQSIAKSKGKTVNVDYTSLVVPGVSLNQMYNKSNYKDVMKSRKWDYVVLQEIGGFGINNYKNTIKGSYDVIRKINADVKKMNARTILYIPPLLGINSHTNNYSEYQSSSDWVHNNIASEIGAAVAPAGYVVAIAAPKFNFKPLQDDDLHNSYESAYLTACTIYATIFNESPEFTRDGDKDYTKWQQLEAESWQNVNRYYDENKSIPCLKLSNNASGHGLADKNLKGDSINKFLYLELILICGVLLFAIIFIILIIVKKCRKIDKDSKLGNSNSKININIKSFILGLAGIVLLIVCIFPQYITIIFSALSRNDFFRLLTPAFAIYILPIIPIIIYLVCLIYGKIVSIKSRFYIIVFTLSALLTFLYELYYIYIYSYFIYIDIKFGFYKSIPHKSSSGYMTTQLIILAVLLAFLLELISYINIVISRRKKLRALTTTSDELHVN